MYIRCVYASKGGENENKTFAKVPFSQGGKQLTEKSVFLMQKKKKTIIH